MLLLVRIQVEDKWVKSLKAFVAGQMLGDVGMVWIWFGCFFF